MSALWLFIGDRLRGVWVWVAGAAVALLALVKYGLSKKVEGRREGRDEARKEARKANEEMRDDVHRVLDDPNALFRVRDPKRGGHGQDGTPGT